MKTRAGGLTHHVQSGQVAGAVLIDHHAATGVVGGGYHRDSVNADIDTQGHAAIKNSRKMGLQKAALPVTDVEVDTIESQTLHFMINGAGHDIPWGKVTPGVEAGHKRFPIRQLQCGALTAQCFGDQEGFRLGVVQAGGVELVKFHIRHPAARPPGDRDPVTTGAIRVGGIEVGFAGTPRREDHGSGSNGVYPVITAIQHISPHATATVPNEVYRITVRQQGYIFRVGRVSGQHIGNGPSRAIRRVDDPSMAVATFHR